MPWWGGLAQSSRHPKEAELKLRILPRDVCVHFIVHRCCLEKRSCIGYEGSWFPSSQENTFQPIFSGSFEWNNPASSKSLVTCTTPCPGPCSLSGDMRVARLGTPWWQWEGCCCVTGISESILPPHNCSCNTERETQSTAKPGKETQGTAKPGKGRGGFPWRKSLPNHLSCYQQTFPKTICLFLLFFFFLLSPDSVTITHKDVQWVGAWWLGYLIAGVISVLAGIPFWFLPRHLPKPESRKDSSTSSEQSKFIIEDNKDQHNSYQQQLKMAEMVKGKSLEFFSESFSHQLLYLKSLYLLRPYFSGLRIAVFPQAPLST